MTDKITNIEELHELINPELLTTEQSCFDMLDRIYKNRKILNDYGKKLIKRIAKIDDREVYYSESDYTVTYCDYFVAKDKDEISGLNDSLFDEIIEVHDSINIGDFEKLEE